MISLMGGYTGRLGNQVFQRAAVIGHALKYGYPYVLEPFYIYDIPGGPIVEDASSYFSGPFCYDEIPAGLEVYNEPILSYSPIPDKDNIMLSGYFQSEKYFDHIAPFIRNIFSPTIQVERRMYNKFPPTSHETCSLHVRRGDYVTIDAPPLPVDYYLHAYESMGADKSYLIFSDDIQWCKDNLKFVRYAYYMEGNRPMEDMFLISMCSNHIMANSTMSWWGQYLDQNKSKRVIAPSRWSYDTRQWDSFYQPNWELVDSSSAFHH